MKRLSFVFIFSLIALLSVAQAKYVFFFIGDGMGPHQVLATEMYLAELDGIKRFINKAENLPFVILAAGPSLEQIIPHLEEIKKRAVTIIK